MVGLWVADVVFSLQDLLRKALVVEERKERAAKKLERRLQLSKMTHDQREKVWQEEMSEGILGGAEQREEETSEEMKEGEERPALVKRPIRAEERKTKKQRRKEQMRRKEVRVLLSVAVMIHVRWFSYGPSRK